jgi:hypothetical protein
MYRHVDWLLIGCVSVREATSEDLLLGDRWFCPHSDTIDDSQHDLSHQLGCRMSREAYKICAIGAPASRGYSILWLMAVQPHYQIILAGL